MVCFNVCEAPLNDSTNGASVSIDDFYTYGEYGFSFKKSWSYWQWVWSLSAILCCLASGE